MEPPKKNKACQKEAWQNHEKSMRVSSMGKRRKWLHINPHKNSEGEEKEIWRYSTIHPPNKLQ